MRPPLVAANWKTTASRSQGLALARGVVDGVRDCRGTEVALFPPHPLLPEVVQVAAGSQVAVGAQDVHWVSDGAFTGAVSPALVAELGCRYGIVGHSERRHIFHEDLEMVRRKVAAALECGLVPILCVGEVEAERDAGRATEVVLAQVASGLEGVPVERWAQVVVAYEPVWAIGTGRAADPDTAQEMHAALRGFLADRAGEQAATTMRILYGGSVNPKVCGSFFDMPDVDGALVGGASRKADEFIGIVLQAEARS